MECPECNQHISSNSRFCNQCGALIPTGFAESTDSLEWERMNLSQDFVGRQREMGELLSILHDVLAGQRRIVMLIGEPGIGKTRIAQELTTVAQQQGANVLWGRCMENQGFPAYWPWIQVLQSCFDKTDPDTLSAQAKAVVPDIFEIVPELRYSLPEAVESQPVESEQARFRLFNSVWSFLESIAQSQPLVLILDNLHWADGPSLSLLEFLGQQLSDRPILIVGTYRDADISRHHPLSETLGQLTRERAFHRLPLRGINPGDVAQYLRVSSGFDPPGEFVQFLHSHTEGNPLFIIEIVRMLQQEGDLTPQQLSSYGKGHNIRLPEGIREVVGRRLNRLPEQHSQILITASVIGREFGFGVLAWLLEDVPESQLLACLEEALEAKLIEDISQKPNQYQFTHTLIRRTLLEELSTTRRVRLHARIAEALEAYYGDNAGSHAAELAFHYGESETVLGNEKLVYYLCLAGEQALASYAHEEALDQFQKALDALGNQPMDSQRARVLFGLGRAQASTLPHQLRDKALDSLRAAFDYYLDAADVERAVAVARYPLFLGTESRGSADLIERALSLIPDNSLEAGYLLCQYGLCLYHETGEYSRSQEAFDRALDIAHRLQDKALEVQTLANAAHIDGEELNLDRCLERSRRAIELAARFESTRAKVWAHIYACVSLIAMGDLDSARAYAKFMQGPAETLRDPYLLGIALRFNQVVSLLEGNWQSAREFGIEGLAIAPSDEFLLGNQMLLEYESGNLSAARTYLERLLESVRQTETGPSYANAISAMAMTKFAYLTNNTSLLEDAEATARSVLSVPNAQPNLTLYARMALGLIAVQRGDVEAALEQYTVISEKPGLSLPVIGVVTDHLLGLIARMAGHSQQARNHLEGAIAFCDRAGYRYDLAWAYYDYADTLLEFRTPDVRARVVESIDEALAIANDIGMQALKEKADLLKEDARLQGAGQPFYPDGLTEREVEVLRLIARGRSNNEIASELFISANTVAHHITHILDKVGASNRAEAAAYAIQRDLMPQ